MDETAERSPEIGSSVRAVYDVLKAARFAAERHSRQRRKGATAEPYINHLLERMFTPSGHALPGAK